MGETNGDAGNSVTTDTSGNIYLTGYFQGTVDFNPSGTADNHTSNGSIDIFLTKINSDGSYGWTKTMGGTDYDDGYSVTTDSSGNIYLTGNFYGTANFNPDGTDNHTSNGSGDIFLTRINSDGSYGWTKTMGGTGGDIGTSVTTDSSGNIYLTGWFRGTVDFNPSSGVDNYTANSGWDDSMFVTALDSSANYLWTRTASGGQESDGNGIAIHGTSLYITGDAYGTVDFDPQGSHDYIAGTVDNGSTILTKYVLTSTVTPTPTPIPSSSSSSSDNNSSSNSSGSPSCTSAKPTSSPNLFEIDAISTKVTLYFAPAGKPYSDYYISYGNGAKDEEYSASFALSNTNGAIYYTVNELNPNTIYSFKVRAGNGCTSGEWSKTMKISTTGGKVVKKYYSSLISSVSSNVNNLVGKLPIVNKLIQTNPTIVEQPTTTVVPVQKPSNNTTVLPTQPPEQVPIPTPTPKKKTCFFFICW
jgi:hypothetical protein